MNKAISIILSVMFLWSYGCKQVNTTKETSFDDSTEKMIEFNSSEELMEVYYRFPSPEEMLTVLDYNLNIFDLNLLNAPEKSKQYLDSRSQALNLGVYAADLAYLTLFEQHKESMKYFEAVYELSDKLRISSAFEISLLKRVQANMTNSDSLRAIADYAFTSILNYLTSINNEKVFAIISMGGFVEVLYLSFGISGDFDKDNQVVQYIADQKFVLENILKYSHQFSGDKQVLSTIKTLHPIRATYNKMVLKTEETVVTRAEDGSLIISGGEKLIITQEQYIKLKEATFKARKQITQN